MTDMQLNNSINIEFPSITFILGTLVFWILCYILFKKFRNTDNTKPFNIILNIVGLFGIPRVVNDHKDLFCDCYGRCKPITNSPHYVFVKTDTNNKQLASERYRIFLRKNLNKCSLCTRDEISGMRDIIKSGRNNNSKEPILVLGVEIGDKFFILSDHRAAAVGVVYNKPISIFIIPKWIIWPFNPALHKRVVRRHTHIKSSLRYKRKVVHDEMIDYKH